MAIEVSPRLTSRHIQNDEAGAVRRAVREVRVPAAAEVEAHVVDGRVRVDDIRGEGVRREAGPVQVEADDLGPARHRREQVRAVHLRAARVERPHAVEPVDDDGLHEEELVRRDAVSWVARVCECGGRVPLLAVRRSRQSPWE